MFDGSPEEFAAKLVKTIEEGMEKSKTSSTSIKKKSTKPTPISEPDPEENPEVADEDFDIFDDDETPQEEEAVTPVDKETLTSIRSSFKSADADTKSKVKAVLSNYNGKLSSEMRASDVEKIKEILGI